MFPEFDGREAWGWLISVEQYCEARGIPEEKKFSEAKRSLRRDAYYWWYSWKRQNQSAKWWEFVMALLREFEPEADLYLPDSDQELGEEEIPRTQEGREEERTDLIEAKTEVNTVLLAPSEIELPLPENSEDSETEQPTAGSVQREEEAVTTVKSEFAAAVATDLEVNKRIQIPPEKQNRGVVPAMHSTPPAEMTKVTGGTGTTEMRGHAAGVSQRRGARRKKPHKRPPPKPPELLEYGVVPAAHATSTTAAARLETRVTTMMETRDQVGASMMKPEIEMTKRRPPPKSPESLDSGVGPAALTPPTAPARTETQATQTTVAKVLERHEKEIFQQGGANLELQQISQHLSLSQHLSPPFDLMGRAQQVCNYFTTQKLLPYSLLLSQNRGSICEHIDCGPLVKKGTGPFKKIIFTMNLEDAPVKEQLQPSFSAGIERKNLCRDSAIVGNFSTHATGPHALILPLQDMHIMRGIINCDSGWKTFHECSYNEDKEESDILNGGQAQRKLSDLEDNVEKIGNFLSFEKSIVQGEDNRLSCGCSSFRGKTDIDGTSRVWAKGRKPLLPKTSNIDDGIVIRYWFRDALSLLLESPHWDTKMEVDTRLVAKRPPPEPPDHDVEGHYCIQWVLWLADKDNSTVVQGWEKVHWVNISDARTSYAYNPELLAYKFTTVSKTGRCSGFSGLGVVGLDLATQFLSSHFCKVSYDANVGGLVRKSQEVRKDVDVPTLLQLQEVLYACTQVVLAEETMRESWPHMTPIKVLLLLEMGCQTVIWNPKGCSDFSATTWPTYFPQWDPGGGFFSPYPDSTVKWIKGRLLQDTLRAATYIQEGFSTSILEDKDVLRGGVMIGTQLLGIGPILLESMTVRGRGAMHQINSHERSNHLLRWHELCR